MIIQKVSRFFILKVSPVYFYALYWRVKYLADWFKRKFHWDEGALNIANELDLSTKCIFMN